MKKFKVKISMSTSKKYLCYLLFGHNWEKMKVSEDDSVYYWKCDRCGSVKAYQWDDTESRIDVDYLNKLAAGE